MPPDNTSHELIKPAEGMSERYCDTFLPGLFKIGPVPKKRTDLFNLLWRMQDGWTSATHCFERLSTNTCLTTHSHPVGFAASHTRTGVRMLLVRNEGRCRQCRAKLVQRVKLFAYLSPALYYTKRHGAMQTALNSRRGSLAFFTETKLAHRCSVVWFGSRLSTGPGWLVLTQPFAQRPVSTLILATAAPMRSGAATIGDMKLLASRK